MNGITYGQTIKAVKNLLECPFPQICKHTVALGLLNILKDNGHNIPNSLLEAVVKAEDQMALDIISKKVVKMFSFTLLVGFSLPINEEEFANKLYENGCDDALFSFSNGNYEIDFNREGTLFADAFDSAKSDVIRTAKELDNDVKALDVVRG